MKTIISCKAWQIVFFLCQWCGTLSFYTDPVVFRKVVTDPQQKLNGNPSRWDNTDSQKVGCLSLSFFSLCFNNHDFLNTFSELFGILFCLNRDTYNFYFFICDGSKELIRFPTPAWTVFRIQIQIGSGFWGPLDPDTESGGLNKGQKCKIIMT